MKYMLHVRFGPATERLAALPQPDRDRVTTEFEAIRRLPEVIAAGRLAGPETAKTVQEEDGQHAVAAGPAVEPSDAIDGYYVVEGDLDDATTLAARIPVVALGATVEVRPVRGD